MLDEDDVLQWAQGHGYAGARHVGRWAGREIFRLLFAQEMEGAADPVFVGIPPMASIFKDRIEWLLLEDRVRFLIQEAEHADSRPLGCEEEEDLRMAICLLGRVLKKEGGENVRQDDV